MTATWKKKRWSDGDGVAFPWRALPIDSLASPEAEWPFELPSPAGKHMHMSESEEFNGFILLIAPPVRGYYDMGYVDEDGDWWWVGLREEAGDRLLVARPVTREEAGDRILKEFDLLEG